MDSVEKIKERIIEEMDLQGLNQAEVERRGRLRPTSLWDLLNRASKRPSHKKFAGIARGLGKSVVWLTGEIEMVDDELSGSRHHLPRSVRSELSATDAYMARIVEDLIAILVNKNLVSEAELPDEARRLIERRRNLRTVA